MKNDHLCSFLWYNELNLNEIQDGGLCDPVFYRRVYGIEGQNEGETMELKADNGEGIDSWREVTLIYNAALRQIETRMEILNDEFQHVHQYNPIEHIKSRIKTPESIVKKLKRHQYEYGEVYQ